MIKKDNKDSYDTDQKQLSEKYRRRRISEIELEMIGNVSIYNKNELFTDFSFNKTYINFYNEKGVELFSKWCKYNNITDFIISNVEYDKWYGIMNIKRVIGISNFDLETEVEELRKLLNELTLVNQNTLFIEEGEIK